MVQWSHRIDRTQQKENAMMYQRLGGQLWPTTDSKGFRAVRRAQKRRHIKKLRRLSIKLVRAGEAS